MRLARQPNQRPAMSALDRASIAWREAAYLTRRDARSNGVTGELKALDDMASGHRGRSGPTQLSKLAAEMRASGITRAEAEERLRDVAGLIVALVYDSNDAA